MKKTILIVDDEIELLNLMCIVLGRENFNVLRASSGDEAYKIAKNSKIDLIVSDIRMANGTGDKLLKDIRSEGPNTPPLIFITGFSDITLTEAYDMGAEAFFKKPVDFKALIKQIHHQLDQSYTKWTGKPKSAGGIKRFEFEFHSQEECSASTDLSFGRGGLFLSLSDNYPEVDEVIEFAIEVNGETPIKLTGQAICRWRRTIELDGLPTGIGIEYVQLDGKTAEALQDMAEKHSIRAYIPISA